MDDSVVLSFDDSVVGDIFVHDGNKTHRLSDRALEGVIEKLATISKKLTGVQVPHNKLTSASSLALTNAICWFTTLRLLDVSFNNLGYVGVSSIAKAAQSNGSLVSLSVAGNNVSGKDCDSLMKLLFGPESNLRHINLSDNKLGNEGVHTIAMWLQANTVLEELQLQACGFNEQGLLSLLQGVAQNYVLEVLSLTRNTLAKLAKSTTFSEQVKRLLFRSTSLVQVQLPEVLPSFQKDLDLFLHQNSALRRGDGLAYLSERKWSSIPFSVLARDTLTKLDLSSNNLPGLPFAIVHLRAVDWLNIAKNAIQIDSVPLHCREMPSLESLRVDGNPFVGHVPARYDTTNLESLFAFFDFFSETKLQGVELKLVVVGADRSGKTRFVKNLMGSEDVPLVPTRKGSRLSKQIKNVPDPVTTAVEEPSTLVSVTKVGLPLPDRSAKLNVWDFSVPDIEHHPMVQFFLTDGAFYAIVVNPGNSDWRESVRYWTGVIQGKVMRADVFFIVTHKDRYSQACNAAAAEILRDYPVTVKGRARGGIFHHGVWCVSNTSKDVQPVLSKMAVVADPRVSAFGRIPVSWSVVESILAQDEQVLQFPVISLSTLEMVALSCSVLDTEVTEMARYLHENGSIIHYSMLKKLQDFVILSPMWLLKVVSRLLKYGAEHFKNGTFQLEDVPEIWPSNEFPARAHSLILNLLEAFEVINPLGQVYVMPFLVPDMAPKESPLDDAVLSLRYERLYVFENEIPHTMMAQLIIRSLEIATRVYNIWQSGVIFSLKERMYLHLIEVKFNRATRELSFCVRTDDKSGKILHILHTTTESVLDGWYKNMRYASFAVGSSNERVSLEELAKLTLQKGGKAVAVREDLAPDILMKSAYRVKMEEVQEMEFIAAGSFGSVTRGMYRGQEIVVKRMITLEQMSEPEMYGSFLKECWAMSFLRHECTIRLLGISLEPLCMVLEYMNHRDLRHFLDHFALPPWTIRLKVMMDIARGMSYAHEQFPAIVHRDLKSPNVFLALVDGVLVAKVADLGLATVLPKLMKNAVVENPTWSAPEVIAREPYSLPADVYSFGIMMWEALTGEFPFHHLWSVTQFTTEIIAKIMQGARPLLPPESTLRDVPPGYIDLMKSAWAHAEGDRPSFNQICQGLAIITRAYANKQGLVMESSSPSTVSDFPPPVLSPQQTRKPLRISGPPLSSVGTAEGTGIANPAASPQQRTKAASPLPPPLSPAVSSAAASGSPSTATAAASAAAPAAPAPKPCSIRLMHRLPRYWGGLSTMLDDSRLITVRSNRTFDVTNLRTDFSETYEHRPCKFSLADAEVATVNNSAWFVNIISNEILILEPDGRSDVAVLPDVVGVTSVLVVRGQVWVCARESLAGGYSLIYVLPPDRSSVRVLARVKGELRRGLAASNFSVYFSCIRVKNNKVKRFLWRMRLSDKKCAKVLLPSAASCLIDVQHRAEIWAVCPESSCILRVSYDLKELGRIVSGQNIFQYGTYIDRLRIVASIGTASACLWNCEDFSPFSIRALISDSSGFNTSRPSASGVRPHLLHAPAFSELIAITAEQMTLFFLEASMPAFRPAPRADGGRKTNRVERREKATRTLISTWEAGTSSGRPSSNTDVASSGTTTTSKSNVNSLSVVDTNTKDLDRYSFVGSKSYDAQHRPMGLMSLLAMESSEDLFSDDALQKFSASKRSQLQRAESSSLGHSVESESSDAPHSADRRASAAARLGRKSSGDSTDNNNNNNADSGRSALPPKMKDELDESGSSSGGRRRSASVAGSPVARKRSLSSGTKLARMASVGSSMSPSPSQPRKPVDHHPLHTKASGGAGAEFEQQKLSLNKSRQGRSNEDLKATPEKDVLPRTSLINPSEPSTSHSASTADKLVPIPGAAVVSAEDSSALGRTSGGGGAATSKTFFSEVAGVKRRSRLQGDQRRMSTMSVNIGGVAIKLESQRNVPRLDLPTTGQEDAKRRPSPRPNNSFFRSRNNTREDNPATISTGPGPGEARVSAVANRSDEGSSSSNNNNNNNNGNTLKLPPPSHVVRSRRNTTAGDGTLPRTHQRTHSSGTAPKVDPDLQEVRSLLTAKLGDGISAMKGRSGSISGPTTVRRSVFGKLSPESDLVSPPSSDEARHTHLTPQTPSSPHSGSAEPSPGRGASGFNLIDARDLEQMYARARRDGSGSSSTSRSPSSNVTPPLSVPATPTNSRGIAVPAPSASSPVRTQGKIPRAISRLSNFFGSRSKEASSTSPASSSSGAGTQELARSGEWGSRIERNSFALGTSVNQTLLRIAQQADAGEVSTEDDKSEGRKAAGGTSARRVSLGESYEESGKLE